MNVLNLIKNKFLVLLILKSLYKIFIKNFKLTIYNKDTIEMKNVAYKPLLKLGIS
ncbi:hypothetical protein GCM10007962_22520 [Yeosuana aromativorans]|uniref:Uncharacterized protein n=1 Tax=Yeosuana aromativorans TaxID=288019 RepID=A0A8J3FKD4_9FLAO|nr:hypothetical protein GCM10007962_22520 [Yeosuana aromativorans]